MPRNERWGEEYGETLHDEWIGGQEYRTRTFAMSVLFEDYKAIRKMNASTLVHGVKSMRRLKRFLDGDEVSETDAMRLGTAIHCAVLEPEKFAGQYAVMPNYSQDPENVTDKGVRSFSSVTKYVKTKQEEWRCINGDKTELTEFEYATCQRVVASVKEIPHVIELLDSCEKEVTVEGVICGVECKGRIDFFGSVIGDLKTTQSVETQAFSRVFFNLEYGFKLAFYRELVRQSRGDLPVVVLAVETSGDFDRCLYRVPSELLDYSMDQVNVTLMKYRQCLDSGIWPGVDNGFDAVDFPVPGWMVKSDLDWSHMATDCQETSEEVEAVF